MINSIDYLHLLRIFEQNSTE